MIYCLVTNKYATLKELRDDYEFAEAIDLYDACLTHMYNQHSMAMSKRGD